MTQYSVVEVNSEQDIVACFNTMQQLRPKLVESEFVALVNNLYQGGYRLLSLANDLDVVAVAGYRVSANLVMGKKLYIEDLVVSETVRGQGIGSVLFNHLEQLAKRLHCQVVHLDSGTQRHQAHKFYFDHGMQIFAYHFTKHLSLDD